MSDHIQPIADGFWNIRGSFKIAGLLDICTHASLVRLHSGKYVLLDAYTLDDKLLGEVQALTNGGRDIEALINLHPFHTVHVKRAHAQFPEAKLYGTERHVAKAADLPWQPERTDSAAFAALYADDFEFWIPDGVDFISADENVHFSSVLALHPATRTLHVDDTLMFTKIPLLSGVRFHPTLAKALKPEAGAADAFRQWAHRLADRCDDIDHLCAAHTRCFHVEEGDAPMSHRVRHALQQCEKVLKAHERTFGGTRAAPSPPA